MIINGKEYVEKDKYESKLQDLKTENHHLKQILNITLPLEKEQLDELLKYHHNIKATKYKLFDQYEIHKHNSRADYECQIYNLQNQIAGLKSKIARMENQRKKTSTGVELTQKDVDKLSEIKELLNGIFDNN